MPSKKQRAKAAKAANDVQPCSLPPQFDEHDGVRAMRALVNAGILEWEVGTKRGSICSRVRIFGGTVDTLTAVQASDRDYGTLVAHHVLRAQQLLA